MNQTTPKWVASAFKFILRLYPARFRDDWQDEMESVLRSDHLQRTGRLEQSRFWLRTLGSTIATAPKEHLFDLGADLRYTLRTLKRRPVFLLVSVASMAIGIGAATVVAATLSSLFLQPVAGVADADRLINIKPFSSRSETFDSISYPDYLDLQSSTSSVADLAIFRGSTTTVRATAEDDAVPVLSQFATSNFLPTLGVVPSQGRFFVSEEDHAARPMAVVSHWLWENRLGSRADLGSILVNGESLEVIGVGPAGFRGNFKGFPSDLFLPLPMGSLAGLAPLEDRAAREFEIIGRLAPSETVKSAAVEFDRLGQLMAQNNLNASDLSLQVEPMTGIDADFRSGLLTFLLLLLAVTGLILVVATLNVAGMMASRAAERAQETTVRMALGAPRYRLSRQLTVEALLLGVLSAAAGLAFSVWGITYVGAAFGSIDSRVAVDIPLDGVALTTAIGLALAVALLASFASGSASRRSTLVQSQRGTSPKQRWRRALVVGQVLLSFVVLTCAVFFLRALNEAGDIEIGFDPDPVAITTLSPRLAQMDSGDAQQLFKDLVNSVEDLPAVERAALITRVPLGLGARFFPNQSEVGIPGHEPAQNTDVLNGNDQTSTQPARDGFAIETTTVGEGAFEVLGLELVEGRPFFETDDKTRPAVVVVNQVFAHRFFDGEQALGQTIFVEGEAHSVIGVARNAKYRTLNEAEVPFLYLSFHRQQPGGADLIVKAQGAGDQKADPTLLLSAIRDAQRSLAPDLPVLELGTVADRIASSVLPQRVGAVAAGALGLLGLFLTAIGLAGVLAHWVDSRRREIGLRMSVGASPSSVLSLVVSQGAWLGLLGMALGLPLAFGLSKALAGFLYGVPSLDPWTYLSVGGILVVTILLACAAPALRASRLDPLAALRAE